MSTAIQIPDALKVGALSLAVISPNEHRRNAALNALAGCQNGRVREFIAYPQDLNEVPGMLQQNFDVVIIDLDSEPEYALDLVESICANGSTTVMVFSEKANPELLLRCMRAGAREFLTLPLSPTAMAEALVRAAALRPVVRPVEPKAPTGQVFGFLSAKGGSGVTTLACNFAVSLARESNKKTLLIDLNLPLGDAAINLGIKAEYSTVSALQNSARLDAMFLSGLVVQHSSGLYVLAAPSELAPADIFTEAIDKLLEVARQEFDYVVVDAGSRLELQATHLFDPTTTIYLVTQVGIPELRNSNRLISKLTSGNGPKLEVVINRFDPRNVEIDEHHVTKALTRKASWKVPNDYAAVRKMQNTATPLVLENSPISRMIGQMTKSVCGRPAESEEEEKGFSLFRWKLSRAD
jgi:pilus assembly protein CpaE